MLTRLALYVAVVRGGIVRGEARVLSSTFFPYRSVGSLPTGREVFHVKHSQRGASPRTPLPLPLSTFHLARVDSIWVLSILGQSPRGQSPLALVALATCRGAGGARGDGGLAQALSR